MQPLEETTMSNSAANDVIVEIIDLCSPLPKKKKTQQEFGDGV